MCSTFGTFCTIKSYILKYSSFWKRISFSSSVVLSPAVFRIGRLIRSITLYYDSKQNIMSKTVDWIFTDFIYSVWTYGIWSWTIFLSFSHNRLKPGSKSPEHGQPILDRRRTKQAEWYQCAWPDCILSFWFSSTSGTNLIIRSSPNSNFRLHPLHESRTSFVYSIAKSGTTFLITAASSDSISMSSIPLQRKNCDKQWNDQ